MHLVSLLAALLASTAAEPPAPADAPAGVLKIRMTGFRSADGQVLIAVFKGGDGFPGAPDKAWQKRVAKISGQSASVELTGVPAGEYAISVVHDENGNNDLDTSWIGIPKEGIGMSNNAKGRMGPPKYRDAKFTVGEAGGAQTIAIVYL